MKWLTNLLTGGERVVPTHVESADDFLSVVERSDKPVLVYVWSETCQPCRKMADEIVATATKHRDAVQVAEVSASSADPRVLATLKVRATPTVVVFDRGKEMGRVSGFRPRSWFDDMIATEFS
ncbi:MAG: thioredoxin family protein [Sandaracinaceae bacterium]